MPISISVMVKEPLASGGCCRYQVILGIDLDAGGRQHDVLRRIQPEYGSLEGGVALGDVLIIVVDVVILQSLILVMVSSPFCRLSYRTMTGSSGSISGSSP